MKLGQRLVWQSCSLLSLDLTARAKNSLLGCLLEKSYKKESLVFLPLNGNASFTDAAYLGFGLHLLPCSDGQDLAALHSSLCAAGRSEGLLAWQTPEVTLGRQFGGSPPTSSLIAGSTEKGLSGFSDLLLQIFAEFHVFCGSGAFSPLLQNEVHHKYQPLFQLVLPTVFPRSSMILAPACVPLLAVLSSSGESSVLGVPWGACLRASHVLAGTKTWS